MKKNGRIYARVSDEEFERLERACRTIGISRSEFVRFSVSLALRDGDEVAAATLRVMLRQERSSAP